MLDCPELMEEFDIRDEYELHNLLKKTEKKWNTDAKQQISLQRMPLISFGLVNREKQIKDLLYQIARLPKKRLVDITKRPMVSYLRHSSQT